MDVAVHQLAECIVNHPVAGHRVFTGEGRRHDGKPEVLATGAGAGVTCTWICTGTGTGAGSKAPVARMMTVSLISALIISLYSKRQDTFCESHAHSALVDAIAANSALDASELMTSHLVDLLSGIELSDREPQQLSLSEILKPHVPAAALS